MPEILNYMQVVEAEEVIYPFTDVVDERFFRDECGLMPCKDSFAGG